jgi:hypothetical protein
MPAGAPGLRVTEVPSFGACNPGCGGGESGSGEKRDGGLNDLQHRPDRATLGIEVVTAASG